MLQEVLNMAALRLHLTMFCIIITDAWWNISNSYMARGYLPSLNIPEKLHWQHLFESQKKQRLIAFILVNKIQYPRTLKNSIYYSSKRVPPSFFHSNTNPVFCHVLIHSFDKTHVLVVTVELIWLLLLNILSFNFVPMPNKFLLGWQDSEEAM